MLLRSWRCGSLLSLLLVLSLGCNRASELPPGGLQAVAFWHKVLQQHPDLPEKVQAIVEKQRQPDYLHSFPQSEVRVYGADEVVSVHGRHVDVVVTDLDDDTLRKLLAWWKEVPRLAGELNLDTTLPFSLPESTKHIVVLGRGGHIAVSGPSGQNMQSIHILSDQVAGRTTIGVHAFGPEGEAVLDHMANQYKQVRGPPRSELNAGHISLPPPEENVTVLVVGRLSTLDISGPADDAQQEISFADYLNLHDPAGETASVLAGTPFAAQPQYVAERLFSEDQATSDDNSIGSETSSTTPGVDNGSDVQPVQPLPFHKPPPIFVPPVYVQPPVYTPPVYTPPPVYMPPVYTPPVVIPPVYTPPPVYVPRFGS